MPKKETPSEGNGGTPRILVEADQILDRYNIRHSRLPFIRAGLIFLIASFGLIAGIQAADECNKSSLLIPAVTRAERVADYQKAVNLGNSYLNQPAVCEANKRILARQVFVDGLETIYAQTPDAKDFLSQQRARDQYVRSRLTLLKYKVPESELPTRMQIAGRALQSNQLYLGRQVINEAVFGREIDDSNTSQLKIIYMVWNRLGESQAQEGSNNILRSRGLGLLASANDLSQSYLLNEFSARETLSRALGENSPNWPLPSEPKIRPRTN